MVKILPVLIVFFTQNHVETHIFVLNKLKKDKISTLLIEQISNFVV